MSDTKIFSLPDTGTDRMGNDWWPLLLAGGGMGGFGGWGNGFLPFLLGALFTGGWGGFGGFGGFGNGFGGGGFGGGLGYIANALNNDTGRDLIMQAIQGNATAISQLASTLNCSVGELRNALSAMQTQLCGISSQLGLGQQQIINAVQSGDASIIATIGNCCCELKGSIKDVAIGQERGFASVAYETQRQTCDIEKAIASSTDRILEGQRAAEMREMQDKIDMLREKNAQQAVILNNAQQTAQFSAMLAPIAEDLASIKCKLPKTEVVNVQPEYIPINRGVNVSYAPYYGCGFGSGYGFPFGNGNGSLWG